VVGELRRYWQAAIQPLWERLRARCMADLADRMDQFTSGGLARVRTGLHPDITKVPKGDRAGDRATPWGRMAPEQRTAAALLVASRADQATG
jgi:hypothetical protein